MKKFLTAFAILMSVCTAVRANQEISIKLDNRDNKFHKEKLGFADITFECLSIEGTKARVQVSIENITQNPPHALLIFKNEKREQSLKRMTPRIKFDKMFPGQKGNRRVLGSAENSENSFIILPNETVFLYTVYVSVTDSKHLVLPLYLANYQPKKVLKKGKHRISYKVLEERVYDFILNVEGWTRNDPDYVKTQKEVEDFVASMQGVTFCPNAQHSPSLQEQEIAYKEEMERLKMRINAALGDWMSTDSAYVAYSQLFAKVDVNMKEKEKDCGRHAHNCSYCTQSAQQLYHLLDDTYQQLYAGQVTRPQAASIAKAVQLCYQSNGRRKKSSFYSGKISSFCNQILSY